jgi:branched-chain amino acid aminotransferase
LKLFAYVNGRIMPAEKASVSIFDRGFVIGDGLFETLRAVDFIPEFFKPHYDRLKISAKKLGIRLPVKGGDLMTIINTLCKKSKLEDAVVRITLTRGAYSGTLSILPGVSPTLTVAVTPVKPDPEIYKKGVSVIISKIDKKAASGADATVKTTNYLTNILAKHEADKKGCYEALFLDEKGKITEFTTANFFCVIKGSIITPPIEAGVLPGITRQNIIHFFQQNGKRVREQNLFKKDFSRMTEAFLTSSIRRIVPIVKVDEFRIGQSKPGPVFHKIRSEFDKWCREDLESSKKLLVNINR